jgi:hypothetical protein
MLQCYEGIERDFDILSLLRPPRQVQLKSGDFYYIILYSVTL